MAGKTVWQLLRNKYPAGECVLLEEVSDTTGGRNRSADYIVVNLWPSRGNSIIGFEKKTYRSDWLNELKKPEKQEAIFKFCDYFYLVTDTENIAKIEEIPENWGWMHSDGVRLKIIKQAPKLQPIPCTRQFMCAMMRRADSKEGFVKREDIEERISQEVEQAIARNTKLGDQKIRDYDDLVQKIKDFEDTSGIKINEQWSWQSGKQIGEAVLKVMNWDENRESNKLKNLHESAIKIVKSIAEQIKRVEEISELIPTPAS